MFGVTGVTNSTATPTCTLMSIAAQHSPGGAGPGTDGGASCPATATASTCITVAHSRCGTGVSFDSNGRLAAAAATSFTV